MSLFYDLSTLKWIINVHADLIDVNDLIVNFELGFVQVKQRFHGGTRGKERVKKPVSQVMEYCFFTSVLLYCVF